MRCLSIIPGVVGYQDALSMQERVADARRMGSIQDDVLFLLEHPPTITVGKKGSIQELLASENALAEMGIQVHHIGRGGRLTYHGPGQIVGYPIFDLSKHGRDLHHYLRELEQAIISSLADFEIKAQRKEGLTGVWVGEQKIASIGIQVKRWVSMHGFALNVCPDMNHFQLLQPCGFSADIMTSMASLLNRPISTSTVMGSLQDSFAAVFGLEIVPVSLDSLWKAL